jgi:hypothetical protein
MRNVRFSDTIKSGRKNRPIRFFPTYVTRRAQSLPLHSRAHLVAHLCNVAFIRADGPTDGLGNSTCRISRTVLNYKRNSDCPTDGPLVYSRKLSDGHNNGPTDGQRTHQWTVRRTVRPYKPTLRSSVRQVAI